MKFCLAINDDVVIAAKRTFKGYSEKHRMMKLNYVLSLSEGKAVSGRFAIDSTKTFEGIKIPHRKPFYLDCDNEKFCIDCIIKPKMNFSNCDLKRACKACLDLVIKARYILLFKIC